jgi:heme exporter protein A
MPLVPPFRPPRSKALVQLIAENLFVERGSRTIIRDLSLVVDSGEAIVLSGANGSGKTTLLRSLAGFLRPVSGSVRIDGGDSEKTVAEQAHVVGHANAVKGSLTVRENVEFWARYLGGAGRNDASVDRALDHFGVRNLAEFPVAYLSAGQKRRVGLARLLSAERPVWLLDEPTVSLDTASTALLAKAIEAHIETGGLAIIATHIPLGLSRSRELALKPRGRTA